MSDMRLIDANAVVTVQVFDEMYEEYILETTTIEKVINRWTEEGCPPAIDAVPVVRCRECKHWSGRNDKPGEVTAIGYCNHPIHHIMPLKADWFCADGAKMDGGAEG